MYDFQATNRREGGDTSCHGRSREAPGLHLERGRDRAGGLQNCLARRLLAGGVPGPGVVVKRSYIPSQPYEMAKNGKKTGGFAHVLAYNSPKLRFSPLST